MSCHAQENRSQPRACAAPSRRLGDLCRLTAHCGAEKEGLACILFKRFQLCSCVQFKSTKLAEHHDPGWLLPPPIFYKIHCGTSSTIHPLLNFCPASLSRCSTVTRSPEVLRSRLRREEPLALEPGPNKYWTEVRRGMREMFVRGEKKTPPFWRS